MDQVWYSCQQPSVFPPLFIIERILRLDHWVSLNDCQFDRWHVQYKLGAAGGDVKGSVPLKKPRLKRFDEVELVDAKEWVRKTRAQIKNIYGKQVAFRLREDAWEEFLAMAETRTRLIDLCNDALMFVARQVNPQHKVLVHDSRALIPNRPENPTQWLGDFGKLLGGTDYIQGADSLMDYFDPNEMQHVRVWGQDFRTQYVGVNGQLRNPTYSVLDFLFTQDNFQVKRLMKVDHPSKSVHADRYHVTNGQWAKMGD